MKNFLLVLLIPLQILSATTPGDSLNQLIRQSEGSQKVTLLIKLGNHLIIESRPDAVPVYEQAVELAKSLNDKPSISDALYAAGENYYHLGRQETAIRRLKESLQIAEELRDSSRIGACLLRLGNATAQLNEQEKAEKYYLDALSVIQSLNDPILAGRTLNNLANLYGQWGQYVKALNMFDRVREYYEEAGFTEGLGWLNFSIARLYKQFSDYESALKYAQLGLDFYHELSRQTGDSTGIMISYGQLGDIYIKMGKMDEALKYHQVALRLRQKTGVKSAITDGYRGLGEIYYYQHDYPKALEYFEKALQLRKEAQATLGSATLLKYIGLIHLEQGNIIKGRNYLLGALSLARKSKQPNTEKEVLGKIADIYLNAQDYKKASDYFHRYIAISDSILNFEISNKITSYLVNVEIEKQQKEKELLAKEKRIAELELAQQKSVKNILIILVVSALLILTGFWILYRQKSRDNRLLKEKNTQILQAHQQLQEEIAERERIEKERETLIGELKESLSHIKTLSGLIPICAHCKKIRNDQGYYEQLEKYIMDHSDAVFSHGICPECMEKYYSDAIDKDKQSD